MARELEPYQNIERKHYQKIPQGDLATLYRGGTAV